MMVFWARGYSGVTHSEVIASMGVGRQSSYDTFGNSRALFERALATYGQVRAPVFAALEAPDADLTALRRHFSQAIGFFASHPATPACLATRTVFEADEELRQLAAKLMVRMRRGFLNCLAGAARAGQVRPDVDLEGAASCLELLWHGVGAGMSGGGSEAQIRRAVDAALDGWATAGGSDGGQ